MDSILFQRIRKLCKDRNITIKKMSEDLDIGTSLIRKWKTTTSPSIDKIKTIAEYFDVSTDYLIGRTDIEQPLEKFIGDKDIISIQRARNRMSDEDRSRMMNSLRATFDKAFSEETEESNGEEDEAE